MRKVMALARLLSFEISGSRPGVGNEYFGH
jgi:hypothetical protein